MKRCNFNKLMELCKDYHEAYTALYMLKSSDETKINQVYEGLKNKLLDTKVVTPAQMCKSISNAAIFNNKYIISYFILFKKIFDELISDRTEILSYKESKLNSVYYKFIDAIQREKEINQDPQDILCIEKENPIFKAIMDDDLRAFIAFSEFEGFREDQKYVSDFFPDSITEIGGIQAGTKKEYSLLELCCYYGSVDCFKFLRTRFNSIITKDCLQFSFLSGNPDIMSQCIKSHVEYYNCMPYAIISHNIDFISFLINEKHQTINLRYCIEFNNILAFLVHLDQFNAINECFPASIHFNIKGLRGYLLSHGADPNATTIDKLTALHLSILEKNTRRVQFLIANGANVNVLDSKFRTPLHCAAENNCLEIAKILLSHGAKIRVNDKNYQTPLHYAARGNAKEIVELLLSHDAFVNDLDKNGMAPIHIAALYNSKETLEFLLSHGASTQNIMIKRTTLLMIAAMGNSKETAEFLISHGADVNSNDGRGTPLHYAVINNSVETAKVLIEHGAIFDSKVYSITIPLHIAALMGKKEFAELFFSPVANTFTFDYYKKRTLLHIAAIKGKKRLWNCFYHMGQISTNLILLKVLPFILQQ
ncbi:spectrin binding [Trichomonas vaginalis G3]|uniref:spectrin binding n=1 Tax=Trichomonas vaginalis (strain ATCC PRA-98 / G3) TaxID=412133 RepID=UPI0021E5EE02|nr:spectrin binding [Trichomonas vaginalis G3]KAI5531293.1 spectrin binding [Trichomonas vaginalis G3]